jgi:fermentation-respiration switch protein FrsA (DUF1100 family)
MKNAGLKTGLLAAMAGLTAGNVVAADYRSNPFTLAYEGAITRNVPGKVNIRAVTYKLNGLDIAANVYTPADFDPAGKHPAIVVAHPNGGVKEQVAGLYAQHLAEQGYVAIAADAAYQVRAAGSHAMSTSPRIASKTSMGWRTSLRALQGWIRPDLGCSVYVEAAATRWRLPRRTSASSRSQH